MSKPASFTSDKYRKARGGHSRWLLLLCEKCGSEVAIYQKDGPGMLKRLYLDRILAPREAAKKKDLACKKCKTVLGVRGVYKKENRPAFRLFAGAIQKKIIKQDKISSVRI